MKIRSVDLYEVQGRGILPAFPPGDRQVQMLDIYPEYNSRDWSRERQNGPQELRASYVEVHTDENLSGLFGPIDEQQVFIIATYLRPLLLGQDPLAIEKLHDQMLRLNRHGRSGMFVTGISAIDCALWDLKGKAWNQPLYRLLGGPTRTEIPAYASMLGYSIILAEAASTAVEFRQNGYRAQKWFFRYGPGDGEKGMAMNLDLVAALRAALGIGYPLMFDAYMGWDLPYAETMLRRLEPFHITWLEEPLPPEHISSFQQLHRAASVPLATGEHVYTRWQVRELLLSNAVSYIQVDPDWTGGVSELEKIASLCSAFDVPLVAHGHSLLAALHLAGARSAQVIPWVEYLIQHQAHKQYFQTVMYQPENGSIKLPQLPGLGIVLDDAKIEAKVRF
jgi:L-rhamnonate dehydratase